MDDHSFCLVRKKSGCDELSSTCIYWGRKHYRWLYFGGQGTTVNDEHSRWWKFSSRYTSNNSQTVQLLLIQNNTCEKKTFISFLERFQDVWADEIFYYIKMATNAIQWLSLAHNPLGLKRNHLSQYCPHTMHTLYKNESKKIFVHKRNLRGKWCNNLITRDYKMLNKPQVWRYEGEMDVQLQTIRANFPRINFTFINHLINKYNVLRYLQVSMTSLLFLVKYFINYTQNHSTEHFLPYTLYYFFFTYLGLQLLFSFLSLFNAILNPYCCILAFIGQAGWFSWQQNMANVGRSLNLVLGQKKVLMTGRCSGSLVSLTYFLLYFPYMPNTLLGTSFALIRMPMWKQWCKWLLGY